MSAIEWFFDFISPFAYLQQFRLSELPQERLVLRPVLLAGMLGHWGQKGPAEIPAKRVFTYQYVRWYADRMGFPLRFPPGHPFNPLRALRLSIACANQAEAVRRIFDFIWAEGRDLGDDAAFCALGRELGLSEPLDAIAQSTVKQSLRHNTESAIALGVFGVPTLVIDRHLFFGNDATDMALDQLAHPELMTAPAMRQLAELPRAASRI